MGGDFFTLSIAPSPSGLRWGCVVSKKVAAKAAARNTLKRRVRAILAPQLKKGAPPLALVFQAKRAAAGASFAELKRDLSALVARIP